MTAPGSRHALLVVVVGPSLLLAGCAGLAGDSGGSTASPTATAQRCAASPTQTPVHQGYAETTVTVAGETGDRLGTVDAAIADTRQRRFTGLSETDCLPADRGMLFVYDEPQPSLTYVMRNMSFDLDIVFVHANGTIQSIHHVAAPDPGEDGESITASGRGQYVLEVNRGWTTERRIEAGDRLEIDLPEQ
jgi:uncharacterized membrane protein (UPF0127 family)